jgi:methionine-S-sulfoxide reductase
MKFTKKRHFILLLSLASVIISCGENTSAYKAKMSTQKPLEMNSENLDTITLAGGCFWCVEAVYQQLNGVEKITSGYTGGTVKNPAYREVCEGTTGHAEVAQIIYDRTKVSLKDILEVFFTVHDPTTLNRQGNDYGTQYRSGIFYSTDEQKLMAEDIIKRLNAANVYETNIVTEVTPLTVFYPAEDYHQNYYAQNSGEGYCRLVIQPKLEKFKKVFPDKVKR